MLRAIHVPRASFVLLLAVASPASPQSRPTIEQFMGAANPIELTAANKADRVAWTTYDRGMRNVYSAAAPAWTPVRITRFLDDDGQDVTGVRLSNDGSLAIFVRGHTPNSEGWIANPMHDAAGSERAIWAARTDGTRAWRLVEGSAPELSPDGRTVLYVKAGQIYRVRTRPGAPQDSMDRGLEPFIRQFGQQSSPRWSPDGSKIAFVSNRGNHSFIGLYDVRTRRVDYVAPSVDCDALPTFSPDGRQIAFVRRPGAAFGSQTQQGSGGIGNPPGPASGRGGGSGCGAGFGGFGRRAAAQQAEETPPNQIPGLYRATFEDGSTLRIMIADVAQVGDIENAPARVLWRNRPDERVFTNIARLLWADGHIVFPLSPATEEWDRYWSISISNPQPDPVLLTTTNGLIEDATSAALSADGRTLYYTTNANDIERRHIWAVPVGGGTPAQLSAGSTVETHPQPLASGNALAILSFDARTPASVAVLPASGGSAKRIFPTLPKDFPTADHVEPQIVTIAAPDGLEVHNQLFLPKDLAPGERRPAIVFVHGGPSRQMLPAYHYMHFYAWAYGVNQWLATQGYVVLSVNYRSGIGYGRSFRQAANTQARGNSEYQDVLAAGKYLQSRPDVDPARVGIWGLSYGGLLTAQALARNSDIFVAGVDMAGVHLYGSSLDTASLAFKSSAVGAIDGWKSPVLLVHGDDDRNVNFAQTVGLVQLLRARNVYHELIVIPDDVHESLLHSRWMYTWNRMSDFLKRFVRDLPVAAQSHQR
jgi:dipeptidyl-peptidase 4